MQRQWRLMFCVTSLALAVIPLPLAAEDTKPEVSKSETEARQAMAGIKLPPGSRMELFAVDPQLASPVAICLDERGRVYVAEEYRFNLGTEENRTRPFLLEDDLQIKTLDDRLAMYRKWADKFDGGMAWFNKTADQVRRIEDRDGDGRADHSTIFAGGFNGTLDGLAAGVIAREGKVYFTCIPNLWLLQDADGDGVAEQRQVLQTGFGVNAGFLGHDLHGLAWGPDGRLYFSVGDRGFHLLTKEGRTLAGPRTGAVFRCEPDGSKLEVVHRGLRNPQEIAFDDYGNLFAADNNCDKGDHSRLVFILNGGDSGWNMSYQSLPEPYLTGPWHAEQIWHIPQLEPQTKPQPEPPVVESGVSSSNVQPAWIVPCVGKLGAGPSGFTHYPGVGMAPRYRDHFFMCNYTGNGGLEAFAVQPQGAGFEIVDAHDFLKPIFATDADFGYDGKLYVSDFVRLEWNGGTAGGRIYTLQDELHGRTPAVLEVTELFQKGFNDRTDEKLLELLAHADQRVRQRAQFALVERAMGKNGLTLLPRLLNVVQTDSKANLFARLHAIWALGQIGRTQRTAGVSSALLLKLAQDAEAEVRAQVMNVLADCVSLEESRAAVHSALMTGLKDSNPRVRLYAAQSLGRLKNPEAVEPLVELLRDNQNRDPWLRHAAAFALSECATADTLLQFAVDESPGVRMGVLLALRRHADPRIARFLNDADPSLMMEAARAINDLPLDSATVDLAEALDRVRGMAGAEPLVRRALHANFRLGRPQHARAVAEAAADPSVAPALRAEALAMLGDWEHPGPRDRVTGFWRPLPDRDPAIVKAVAGDLLPRWLANSTGELQATVVKLVTKLGLAVDDELFANWAADTARALETRLASLQLLAVRKSDRLPATLELALNAEAPVMRAEARQILLQIDPARGLATLVAALQNSGTPLVEQQRALLTLARAKSPEADTVLDQWAARLSQNDVPPELQLDLLEAFSERPTPVATAARTAFDARRVPTDPLGRYRIALAGGDAARGREVFAGHVQAQCIRCHKVRGQGGDAGPELAEVAKRHTRETLLESLIDPNAKISPGFGVTTLALASGKSLAGVIKAEDANQVTLQTADGQTIIVPLAEIEDRTSPKSAMPPMGQVLTARDLRDVVEYLSTLK